jgi:PPP family 3-phenylpropionic acid transporter
VKGLAGSFGGMALYFAAEYLATSVYHSGVALFYRAKGFSLTQISLLMGAVPLVGAVAHPLWGMLGDRCARKNTVHRILLLGATIALACYALPRTAGGMLPVVCAYACFGAAITPMSETIALEGLTRLGKGFGPLRLWGTLAFGAGAWASGAALGGRAAWFAYLAAGLTGMAAVVSLALPQVPGHQHGGERVGWRPLLRDKRLRWLLALAAALQCSQGMYFTFYPSLFTDVWGGSTALYGLSMLLSTLSEVPFLFCADRLFQRLGAGRLLVLAGCAMTLHWLLVALAPGLGLLFATQALGGGGLIVLGFTMTRHVQLAVPQELRASGQMLVALVGFGVARTLSGLAGRWLISALGSPRAVFWAMAALAAGAVLLLGKKVWGSAPQGGAHAEK